MAAGLRQNSFVFLSKGLLLFETGDLGRMIEMGDNALCIHHNDAALKALQNAVEVLAGCARFFQCAPKLFVLGIQLQIQPAEIGLHLRVGLLQAAGI